MFWGRECSYCQALLVADRPGFSGFVASNLFGNSCSIPNSFWQGENLFTPYPESNRAVLITVEGKQIRILNPKALDSEPKMTRLKMGFLHHVKSCFNERMRPSNMVAGILCITSP